MKSSRIEKLTIGLSLVFLLVAAAAAGAEAQKIRVVVDNASIRSGPDVQSSIIEAPAFGTVLEVREKVGEWYRVDFQSKMGVLVAGYIHEMFVEEESGKAQPAQVAERRSFNFSLSYGAVLPRGDMGSDDWTLNGSEWEGDDRALFRAPGFRFTAAGEYFLNRHFGVGLHWVVAKFYSREYPPYATVPYRDNEINLFLVGVHGKWAFRDEAAASPYVLLGSGIAVAHSDGFSHFDADGSWHAVLAMDSKPYAFLGGGLDYLVSSRISLFGEATFNTLFWKGLALHGDPAKPDWKLDQDYFFLGLAGGIRVGFGGGGTR